MIKNATTLISSVLVHQIHSILEFEIYLLAAYAAVTSLKYIIDQLRNHPSPPISLDEKQVESLTEKATFLQEFLEGYISPRGYSHEADPLEIRIADAAYAVEDVIESYIVDNIHLAAASTLNPNEHDDKVEESETAVEEISCIHFYQDLDKVIEEMELIKKEVMEMARAKNAAVEPQEQRSVAAQTPGFRSSSPTERRSEMVGFDDVLLHLLDRLTGGNLRRQIIPIIGMGGIGKTTLARNIFEKALIKEHFDIYVWATISQDYNIRESLREVLYQATGHSSGKNENELGEALYKHLSGRRYLVIMDDMWDIEVWDKMKFFFPDYNNGSRVLVTTRLSNMATDLTDPSSLVDMKFLDEISSWILFSKTVFGKESFPLELEEIGKKIVENCKGLPLSIVMIGGLLAKSRNTQHWEHIEENLNSILNSENDEHCLKILKMSYNNLPVYLKPCFLYMGLFKEDSRVSVSSIVKLWVCEGFLKPVDNKSLETVAKVYLKELVDRNLVIVDELGLLGNVKYCKMHDLLRDLALQEAHKQRFYYASRKYYPRGIDGQRLIFTSDEEALADLKSMARARSYMCRRFQVPRPQKLRLLRSLVTSRGVVPPSQYKHSLEYVFQLVNSRYLELSIHGVSKFPSSIELLWNLHTLIISSLEEFVMPVEIWKMHQLRIVDFKHGGFHLQDPPPNDVVVLEKLHTLKGVVDLHLSEDVVKRIPNVKKLDIRYTKYRVERVDSLSYLQFLSKIEMFECYARNECFQYLHNITFPHSLNNIYLQSSTHVFALDDLVGKIGSLPLLRKLKLRGGMFRTGKWEAVEGEFQKLVSLHLAYCDLEEWRVPESSCFPLLEVVRLQRLRKLEEIPLEMGEIATLKLIEVDGCSESALLSAKKIVEEQEYMQGEELSFRVRAIVQRKALLSLATPNFEVKYHVYIN